MNPLKYRLPEQEQTDTNTLHPQPSALVAWIAAQPTINVQSTAPLVLKLLRNYNRCKMPAAVRLRAMLTLQPIIDQLIEQLHSHYQNESLPLRKNARAQADMCLQFLDETSFAYKLAIADSVIDTESNEMSINLFIAALRLTIDQLGKQLLECYAQYMPPVSGLWGELHRTYQLAERNGLHTRVITGNANEDNPFATVQHAYLRLVLLALARPNHLMPGQARLIYDYLEKWTVGCRMIEKKITLAQTGDIVIDLAGERPPAVATGYARFRPVDGRFLDISKLQKELDDISNSVAENAPAKGGIPLTIAERLRRDLLTRLRKAWQGRAERTSERETDMASQVPVCFGLEAAHHYLSSEKDFNPEQTEIQFHRPQESSSGLSLLPTETAWELNAPISKDKRGLDNTRLSRFEGAVDVWDAIHETEIHIRSKREAAMSHIRVEPWLCLNESAGGMALRRLPESQVHTRAGAIVAFSNADSDADAAHYGQWKIGALAWLQNGEYFDIGVMTLTDTASPVAVRAIGGAGTGGEYFRSLLFTPQGTPPAGEGSPSALIVPASIFDVGTQLVLNRETTIEYVRLTHMIETTSSYSLFVFKHIEIPPAEQAKIDALGQRKDT